MFSRDTMSGPETLSELSDAGIIEVSGYVEEGRGAPTKEWTLRRETIEIDLVQTEED